MTPVEHGERVRIIGMPDNGMAPLYEDDVDWRDADGEPAHVMPRFGPYVDLPIPMPKSIMVFTDAENRPLAIRVAGGWCIRRQDVATVWEAVRQYNADVAARGPK